jgi:hypothetical protein
MDRVIGKPFTHEQLLQALRDAGAGGSGARSASRRQPRQVPRRRRATAACVRA